jgi:hypothetical protein
LRDFGCDDFHAHLVELGGFAQRFVGFIRQSRCMKNREFDQQTA